MPGSTCSFRDSLSSFQTPEDEMQIYDQSPPKIQRSIWSICSSWQARKNPEVITVTEVVTLLMWGESRFPIPIRLALHVCTIKRQTQFKKACCNLCNIVLSTALPLPFNIFINSTLPSCPHSLLQKSEEKQRADDNETQHSSTKSSAISSGDPHSAISISLQQHHLSFFCVPGGR